MSARPRLRLRRSVPSFRAEPRCPRQPRARQVKCRVVLSAYSAGAARARQHSPPRRTSRNQGRPLKRLASRPGRAGRFANPAAVCGRKPDPHQSSLGGPRSAGSTRPERRESLAPQTGFAECALERGAAQSPPLQSPNWTSQTASAPSATLASDRARSAPPAIPLRNAALARAPSRSFSALRRNAYATAGWR